MKKLNVLLITGLVLLFTCGTTLAYNWGTSTSGGNEDDPVIVVDGDGQSTDQTAPVPEPATMLLLGSGLVALAAGTRKKMKK